MSYPHLRSQWHHDDLAEDFSLSANDIECLDSLQTGNRKKANRLGLIILLKTFIYLGYPPRRKADIPPALVAHLAEQMGLDPGLFDYYDWKGRVWKRHMRAVRLHCGFSSITMHDLELLEQWLVNRSGTSGSQLKLGVFD